MKRISNRQELGIPILYRGDPRRDDVFLFSSLRSDAVDNRDEVRPHPQSSVRIEREGKPVSTQVFFFLSVKRPRRPPRRSRRDRAHHQVAQPRRSHRRPIQQAPTASYVDEIAGLLDASLPYWIVMDEHDLSSVVDLLEGLQVFRPRNCLRVRRRLRCPREPSSSTAIRPLSSPFTRIPTNRIRTRWGGDRNFSNLLSARLGEKAAWITRPDVFSVFKRYMRTNLNDDSLKTPALGALEA